MKKMQSGLPAKKIQPSEIETLEHDRLLVRGIGYRTGYLYSPVIQDINDTAMFALIQTSKPKTWYST